MMRKAISILQAALGMAGLGWAVFLLPRTSFSWWIGANMFYALMAFASARLEWLQYRFAELAVATTGILVFATVNGYVANMAGRTGGACNAVAGITMAVVTLQVAVLIFVVSLTLRSPR